MERFEHGGQWFAHPDALDFSANLNPLGMPAPVVEALREHAENFSRYPDPRSVELTHAIAAFEGADAGHVLACAGATDAFWRLCAVRRPRHALVVDPCYSGYEQALEQVGCAVRHVALDARDDFTVGEDAARAIDASTDLVFLANPNNPTGRYVDRAVVLACLRRARSVGALLVLDECFVDLTDEQGSVDLLARFPNLVVVKAQTKTFCLAGLRVGYAMSANEGLLAAMRDAGQPWAVSVPAQVAGVACLGEGCEAYLTRSRALVARERSRVSGALASLGLHVVPSQANYLLFCACEPLGAALLERGVLVRSCDNYHGLDERWHRVAVRTPRENDRLLEALEEVLA